MKTVTFYKTSLTTQGEPRETPVFTLKVQGLMPAPAMAEQAILAFQAFAAVEDWRELADGYRIE